jgi:fatty acid desaturase
MSNRVERVAASVPSATTASRALRCTRVVVIAAAILALAALLTLPLGWKEQATFGALLIAVAVLLHVTFSSPTVTLALMAMSVFARRAAANVYRDGVASATSSGSWSSPATATTMYCRPACM